VETLIKVGIPLEEILRVALNREVDLIVMGTHGRTGIANIVIGSVAGKVIGRAPCPVLCIRDRKNAG
jgi:nucleotide-binding universal stress UspA family protein